MNTKPVLAAAVLLLLGACGEGGGMGGGAPKGAVSQERSTAFKSFMPAFSAMGKVVKGDDAYQADAFKAQAAEFAKLAPVPFEHFQSDPDGNGDALPAVWQKPEEFQARQTQFLNAVEKLNAAAQSGNLEEIKAAYGEAGASCKACHDAFRRPK